MYVSRAQESSITGKIANELSNSASKVLCGEVSRERLGLKNHQQPDLKSNALAT